MNEEQFIRNRIKQAREDMGLSQRDMAKLYGTSQSKISDIERGRVQVTALQIVEFARMLNKPITYFFPSDIAKGTNSLESDLLNIFRTLPKDWQERALNEVKREAELYKRLQPYIRAGIPDELLTVLLLDEMQLMDAEEIAFSEGEEFDYEEYKKREGKLEEFLKKHPEIKRRWVKVSGDIGLHRE